MASCPWCKASVDDLFAPCPRCGRRGDEQGALMPGVVDVPDLALPNRPSKGPMKAASSASAASAVPAPAPAARVSAPKVSPPAASHGALDDPGARNFEVDEDDYGDNAPIDLDMSHGPPMISAQVSVPKVAVAPTPGGSANEHAASQVTKGAAALERRAAEGGVDPFEARALSDYGEPPAEWWKTPLYAVRVLRRRPELKKRAALKKREADRAEGAAEDALLVYAELVRDEAQKLAAYGAVFAEVRATEAVVRERDAVLAAEADANKARQAQHDARIAELDATLSQIQMEEKRIAGEFAEADTLAKRAEARAKRAEIEMRNAIAQAGGEETADPKGPA